jgi:hypothetical protein
MNNFLVLTESFALEHNGYFLKPNIFMSVQTIDGRWVISTNALEEFPELFDGTSFETVSLSPSDFPQIPFPMGNQ